MLEILQAASFVTVVINLKVVFYIHITVIIYAL